MEGIVFHKHNYLVAMDIRTDIWYFNATGSNDGWHAVLDVPVCTLYADFNLACNFYSVQECILHVHATWVKHTWSKSWPYCDLDPVNVESVSLEPSIVHTPLVVYNFL